MNPLDDGAMMAIAPGTTAPIAMASAGGAQWTVRGEVVAVASDSGGGIVDVAAGAPAYGTVLRIYIPRASSSPTATGRYRSAASRSATASGSITRPKR